MRLIRWLQVRRRLLAQLLFTALTFISMASLSYYFMNHIIHRHLVQNTGNVLEFTQAQVEAALLEPATTLGTFSETVRRMILRGEDARGLQEYFDALSKYIQEFGPVISSFNGFYGYFETFPGGPIFINGIDWEPPGDYFPPERLWYQRAVEAGGGIVETPPYVDAITGEAVFTYARCIYDDGGNRLGVISVDVHIDSIGKYIVDTALSQGGYGMLISQDLTVYAHPNRDFIGKNMLTDDLPFSVFTSQLLAGEDVSEGHILSYQEEASIAFFRKFSNGWHVGLVAPEGPYYQLAGSMALILYTLAAAFAAVLCVLLIRLDAGKEKAERKTAEANEFNRAILESSPVGFTLADMDENGALRVLDCSDSLRIQFETTNQYYVEHFHEFSPEYQPDGSNSMEKAARLVKQALNGERVMDEWTHCTGAGALIPCELTMKPVTYQGKAAVLAFIYDMRKVTDLTGKLTSRLQQQEALADISNGFIVSGGSERLVNEALAKLGRFHEVSLVLIYRIDYEFRGVNLPYYWSEDGKYPQMAVLNLFDIITANFSENLPENAAAQTQMLCCPDVAAGPEPFHPMLAIGVHAFICVPLYVDGRLWGVLSIEQCYAPRVWTESEKEFVAMTASTIAGAIMRDLYDKRLQEALVEATAASEAKGEFLSNMSHEMRTPLNAIIGMTAIGKKADTAARKDYALDKIGYASTHLLGVINDVLDMSKIEANKLDLSLVEFSFERMLQKIVTVINFRVDEKRQEFTVILDDQLPRFFIGDDQRLSQVLMNLLSNAVKFTPEQGKISLGVYLADEQDGMCELCFEVSDTGIGISPEQQDKLFQAFGQAESGISREFGGTGLGLAISKQIVTLMDGRIWAESELGEGAKFIFTVKLLCGSKNVRSLLAPGVSWETIRVLAVDDDREVRDFFKNLFDGVGVLCDVAADGFEACDIMEERGGYDMYFIDWRMPGMDGIELTRKIKSHDDGKPHIVVMISAVDRSELQDAATEAGVNKYLAKPLLSAAIIDCVNESLGITDYGGQTAGENPCGEFSGKKMLLAEDVEINREIVLSLLEDTGIEIDCAENGREAIEMVRNAPGKYDVVFMDMQMPQMDGLEATRRIRALPAPKKLPIIAMTANVFKHDIDACIAAGMDEHIGKPLDIDEVCGTLRKYLRA